MAKQKHESLAAALSAFQANLPTVAKNATGQVGQNRNYKYADLADISAAAYPRLAEHGLAFISKPTINAAGTFVLAYSLLHESGQREDGEFPLPEGTMQQLGSAVTYSRRYSLCAVTGIVPDEDDDGHGASQNGSTVGRQGPPQQRTNGQQQRPAPQETPAEPPAPPKTPAQARAQLAATCAENGWDLDIVAARFREIESMELGDCTDRDLIVRFRASLFSVSDGELRKQPAANGAAR
jgi:hypothetical protein